ncbi:hypothetical protein [Kitasatospora sp. NPDC058190]|uniref:hypothetical protein n=1 Tax=Kitasatospora sp. NPDC058190 TaxID=3346371 RepID=UPI0036D921D7
MEPQLYFAPFNDHVYDLDLDELDPADEQTSRALARLGDWEDPCIVLAGYDQPRDRQPGRWDYFYLAHDEQMAAQGRPFFLGVHLERDTDARLVRVAVRESAMPDLAEAWLIARGADPTQLRERMQRSEYRAADAETEAAQDLLRHSGTRFDVHDSASSPGALYVTWVIATDNEAPDPARPVAVFVGHRQADSEAFTLRYGHFASIEDAYTWSRLPSEPLPRPGQPGTSRADAARLDRRPAGLTEASGLDDPPTPPAHRSGPERSR